MTVVELQACIIVVMFATWYNTLFVGSNIAAKPQQFLSELVLLEQ